MDSQNVEQTCEMISIKKLSELVGYSEEEIVNELFDKSLLDKSGNIPIQQLRSAMMRFLDRTLIDNSDKGE